MNIPILSDIDPLYYINNKIPFILKDSLTWHNDITLDFLRSTIGDLKVSVHNSNNKSLTFIPKNFTYNYKTINQLLDEIISNIENPDTYTYYRSLGKKPHKDPSKLESLSVDLSEKFKLPKIFQKLIIDGIYKIHSTVLRISHPRIEMWTHYDIFDNILIQTMGSKNITLFDPSTISDLKIDKSTSPLNITYLKENNLNKELFDKSYTGVLYPGDVLFIPSCWPHSVKYIDSNDPCISFNCFLESFHISSVYGNDDPYQIRDGINLLDKIDSMISELPWTMRAMCWSKISLKAKLKSDDIVEKIKQQFVD